ncbi:unnamed protein product [Schistosoma curassoni]|uniref:Leucine-rich repeat domain-containing protein n=1 Tax=Schistosoma curassoni TaxID=6186 RepID=A0A183KXG5_9TREM|nr:unnamed protein product [Schistosoma curassoni]
MLVTYSIVHLDVIIYWCISLYQCISILLNAFQKLPSSIGNLVSMFHLNVDQNQLTELPSEVRNF